MKKFLIALLALALALPSSAAIQSRKRIPLAISKTSTTSYVYCVTLGQDGSPVGAWKQAPATKKVITAGASDAASTTISEATDTDPFALVASGDIMRFSSTKPAADPERVLVTHTTDSSVTVNRAIDLDPDTPKTPNETAGFTFQYRTRSCSATITAQYFPVQTFEVGNILLIVESESGASGGADYKLVCYADGASQAAVIVASGNVTQAQASAGQAVAVGEWNLGNYGFGHCAFGVTASAGTVVYSAYLIVKDLGD